MKDITTFRGMFFDNMANTVLGQDMPDRAEANYMHGTSSDSVVIQLLSDVRVVSHCQLLRVK
jgi:hypothetical protein